MITLPSVSYPVTTRTYRSAAAINLSNFLPLPRAHDADAPGSWRYELGLRRGRIPFVPLLAAASLHGVVLFGLNFKPVETVVVLDEELQQIVMVMPDIEDLEEEPVLNDEVSDAPEIESTDYVPMLADVPSVAVDSAFVQKLDFSSLKPRTDFDAAKVVSIPVGPRSGSPAVKGNMKDLFDLKELDAVPTPVFQPAPVFPASLKREISQATVVVEFIVGAKGKVLEAYVVEATYRGFEDAAIAGVMRWQFRPGMKGGRAVNTRMRVPLMFRVVEGQ